MVGIICPPWLRYDYPICQNLAPSPGTQGFDRPASARTPVATKAQLKAKISGLFSALNSRQFPKFKNQTAYLLQVRTNKIS